MKYRECDLEDNKLCSCKNGYCYDTINGCEYIQSFTEEHGYLIDYNTKWFGNLCAAPHVEKYGWRVFTKKGEFAGILDEEKLACWYVDECSLKEDTTT